MIILGVSHGHDAGAALYIDGEIVVAITDERLSRIKKSFGLMGVTIPLKSINYCLDYAEITMGDVDYVIYNITQPQPNMLKSLHYHYGYDLNKVRYIPHHLAHAATSVFTSNMDECGVIVSDAMGEDLFHDSPGLSYFEDIGFDFEHPDDDHRLSEGWSLYHFNNNQFDRIEKKWITVTSLNHKPTSDISLGILYSLGADQLVGGVQISNAGRLMGLASYADKEWVSKQGLNHTVENDFLNIKNELFFPEVKLENPFQERANVAGLYQREQEEVINFFVDKIKRVTKTENITVGGGSFLNCNTNTNIVESGLFSNSHFYAAADDSGIPLGCALYGAYCYDQPIRKEFFSPYLGREYSREEIVESLNSYGWLRYIEYDNFDELTDIVTDYILENKTVGWFQGRSELGPRALGNRSILANPSCGWMVEYINSEIKKREWYRPFAPSVLHEHQSEIFDLDYFSPYMLLTANVKEEWKKKIPAVTHIDGTSRYQSVTPETNSRYYQLISKFNDKTGVPLLLNTSFNGPNEPIVETPWDAINTFLNEGLDVLVLGDFVITK